MAVRHPHHRDLDALVAHAGAAPRPVSFDQGSPFELEAQLGEESDSGIERFHDDAHVVHPLRRHAAIVADRKYLPCPQGTWDQGRGCEPWNARASSRFNLRRARRLPAADPAAEQAERLALGRLARAGPEEVEVAALVGLEDVGEVQGAEPRV